MSHNVLITGGSGYLGGSLLASWAESRIQGYQNLYALVRTDAQADAVKTLYAAEPVHCDLREESIRDLILEKHISVVIYLIDSYYSNGQLAFIKSLGGSRRVPGKKCTSFSWVSQHRPQKMDTLSDLLLRRLEPSSFPIWPGLRQMAFCMTMIPSFMRFTKVKKPLMRSYKRWMIFHCHESTNNQQTVRPNYNYSDRSRRGA